MGSFPNIFLHICYYYDEDMRWKWQLNVELNNQCHDGHKIYYRRDRLLFIVAFIEKSDDVLPI